jgi:colicin import membrane protein
MARIAVTYEQVAAVANALFAQGVKSPGTKAIREELAKKAGPGGGSTGSPNTIQKHLDQWRQKDRPADPAAPAPQLPPGLAADIARALNAARTDGRAVVEEQLAQVQTELAELVVVGEASEARVDELTQELAARTSERDSMAGQLAERTTEAAETKAALQAANERAATMAHELHAAQAEAQAANGRVEEIRSSTDKQLAKLQGELDQARAIQAETTARAGEAEKRAIGAEAHLDGERTTNKALDAHVAELQGTVKRLEGDASRAAAADAAAAGLRDQVKLLNDTVEMLRSMLKQSGAESAER